MPKGEPPADEAQAAAFRAARRRASQAGRRFRFQGTAPTPHEREVDAKLSSFFNVVFVLMIVFQFCVMVRRARWRAAGRGQVQGGGGCAS